MLNLIRANRPFSIFLATQGLSNLGDSVRMVAVPLLVLQLTHAPVLVAAVALLETAPYFAFHLPMGALLDRIDRRRAMLAADLGRGALVLIIPLTAWMHGPIVLALFLVAAPLSLLSSVFDAGGGAIIPNLVERESLGKAYALFEGAESLAWVAGPMVAGVLAALYGTASALVIDGASFFASAAGLALIRIGRVERGPAEPIWAQIWEGLTFVARTPTLRRLQLTWSLYGLIGYGAVTGLVFIGSRGGRAGAMLASFAVSAYALGSLGGTFFAGRFEMKRVAGLVAGGLMGFAAGAMLVATRWPAGMLAGALGIGAGEGFFLVIWLTRRAQATPERLMARVVTVSGVLARIASGASVTWMALALGWMNGSGAFLIAGTLAFGLAAWTLLAGLRGLEADEAEGG
ncbi:MAG TPA: MFS transporter [Caulobacteraceae bacterium]|nr:MFS transporter [Caulobacteraceae bacterium]